MIMSDIYMLILTIFSRWNMRYEVKASLDQTCKEVDESCPAFELNSFISSKFLSLEIQ